MPEVERIRRCFSYDPMTGEVRWARAGKNRRLGAIAGTVVKRGYRKINFEGKLYAAAVIAFALMEGRMPIGVDHKDRNPSNDRWENLREATAADQTANRGGWGKSGFKGVYPARNKLRPWQALITVQGKTLYLGQFKTQDEAQAEYAKAAEMFFGDFSCLDGPV